jgi:hypothetical protein
MTLEKRHGMAPKEADTPQVYIGDQALVGAEEVRGRLSELIEQYLSQGGADLPTLPAMAKDDKPIARFLYFYGDTCPYCHTIISDYLPTVYEKYGDQVQSRYLEIYNNVENNRAMRGLMLELDVPQDRQGAVPALIIGDKVMVGGDEIPARLEGYIDEYLAQGGVDYPSLDELPYPVEILVFLDPNETYLERLQNFVISLTEQYGAWLRAYGVDLSQSDGSEALAQCQAALARPTPLVSIRLRLLNQRSLAKLTRMGDVTHVREKMP